MVASLQEGNYIVEVRLSSVLQQVTQDNSERIAIERSKKWHCYLVTTYQLAVWVLLLCVIGLAARNRLHANSLAQLKYHSNQKGTEWHNKKVYYYTTLCLFCCRGTLAVQVNLHASLNKA